MLFDFLDAFRFFGQFLTIFSGDHPYDLLDCDPCSSIVIARIAELAGTWQHPPIPYPSASAPGSRAGRETIAS